MVTRTIRNIPRDGNTVAFDFVNTVHSRVESAPREYLASYGDLVDWALDGGLIGRSRADALHANARSNPRAARAALRRAIKLREMLYRIFVAVIRQVAPAPDDITSLNKWLAEGLRHRRVCFENGKYAWSWDPDPAALDRPFWPVVLSAAEVLAGADRSRIKECPAPDGCGWLFLDVSKNGKRRWCNMRTCGNVAKARRYYKRHRKENLEAE